MVEYDKEYMPWLSKRLTYEYEGKRYRLYTDGTKEEVNKVANQLKGLLILYTSALYTPKEGKPREVYLLYVTRDLKEEQRFRQWLSDRLH